MSFISLFTKTQVPVNQHDVTPPAPDAVEGARFRSLIQRSFCSGGPELVKNVCKLFPMDKVVSYTEEEGGGEFTVTFTEETVGKVEETAAKGTHLENVTLIIPQVVRGRCEEDGKLSFPYTPNALRAKKTLAWGIGPIVNLSGLKYHEDGYFCLESSLTTAKVSRVFFERLVKGYKFT